MCCRTLLEGTGFASGSSRNDQGLDIYKLLLIHFVVAPETLFRAVSDGTRRQMLELLAARECSADELAQPFDMSQPAVSQHLKVLRDAGLVTVRKEGRNRIYALNALPLREIHDWASYFEGFWKKRLSALGKRLDDMD